MRTPDVSGGMGRAWRIDLEATRAKADPELLEQDGTVVQWVIEVPAAHPIWHSYMLTLVHFRNADRRRLREYLRGATHELWLHALRPDADRETLVSGWSSSMGPPPVLIPVNFAAQMTWGSDLEGIVEISDVVQDLCNGFLNPDTDFLYQWVERFNDSMIFPK